MALSETVKASLRDAQENLKDALACAARTEKAYVSKNVADMLYQIDTLIEASDMLDKIKCVIHICFIIIVIFPFTQVISHFL